MDRGRFVLAYSYIHLHPDVAVHPQDGSWIARGSNRFLTILPFAADAVEHIRGGENPLQGWYCPEFGKREASSVLEFRKSATSRLTFGYALIPDTSSPPTDEEVRRLVESYDRDYP